MALEMLSTKFGSIFTSLNVLNLKTIMLTVLVFNEFCQYFRCMLQIIAQQGLPALHVDVGLWKLKSI